MQFSVQSLLEIIPCLIASLFSEFYSGNQKQCIDYADKTSLTGNAASALTVQKDFLNKFQNVVSRRVNIREDIKCYQETLSYAARKLIKVWEKIFICFLVI